MCRIRGLELLFNLEKRNMKSKEDCVVAVFHCLLINDNLDCVGVGDEWSKTGLSKTELLPNDWNSNQDAYSLRYVSKDSETRLLLKLTKMEHMLHVDVVRNEDAVASMSVPVEDYIDNNYAEYSTAYKDLNSLCESFRKDVMQKLKPPEKKKDPSPGTSQSKRESNPPCSMPAPPLRKPADLRQESNPYGGWNPRLPRVGGSDLDPFRNGGGMLMDPSSFGIPSRPLFPDFGIGGPGGLPRGAVPPGARFDPIRPPFPSGRFDPNPDHLTPPDADEFYM